MIDKKIHMLEDFSMDSDIDEFEKCDVVFPINSAVSQHTFTRKSTMPTNCQRVKKIPLKLVKKILSDNTPMTSHPQRNKSTFRDLLETIISYGTEQKEDIFLPFFEPKKKVIESNEGGSETNPNTLDSNLQSQVDNFTTNSNTKSIVEFDAMFCSDIRLSMIHCADATQSLANLRSQKSHLLGLNFLPGRKRLLDEYKSINKINQRGEKLRRNQNCDTSISNFKISLKRGSVPDLNSPQTIPIFKKKNLQLLEKSKTNTSYAKFRSAYGKKLACMRSHSPEVSINSPNRTVTHTLEKKAKLTLKRSKKTQLSSNKSKKRPTTSLRCF
jgi:hypothetical protein